MKTKGPLLIFIKKFESNEDCFKILFDYKWKDGFRCRRCGCCKAIAGRTKFHMRCSTCKYDESVTAHTLFHKLKFPIVKAFGIIYQLSTMKKGMSSCEIARQYDIHQETAWFFGKKVQSAMSANSDVDELFQIQKVVDDLLLSIKKEQGCIDVSPLISIGDRSERNSEKPTQRRSTKSKSKISKESINSKKGRKIYVEMLISHQEQRAQRLYHFVNLSCRGLNKTLPIFKHHNLKNWLLGIYHKVSLQHIKKYFGEFIFKLTFRRSMKKLHFLVIQKFVHLSPMPYFSIIAS